MSAELFALPVVEGTGDVAGTASMSGEFNAELSRDGACAWIGERTMGFLWPAGYRVRFDPVQLIGPDDAVVADSGEVINATGELSAVDSRCAGLGQETFVVIGPVEKGYNTSSL